MAITGFKFSEIPYPYAWLDVPGSRLIVKRWHCRHSEVWLGTFDAALYRTYEASWRTLWLWPSQAYVGFVMHRPFAPEDVDKSVTQLLDDLLKEHPKALGTYRGAFYKLARGLKTVRL